MRVYLTSVCMYVCMYVVPTVGRPTIRLPSYLPSTYQVNYLEYLTDVEFLVGSLISKPGRNRG